MTGAHLAVTEPLMTLTEQAEVATRVVRSVSLPVICDANAGYGEPVHAMHTVRTFENAGVASSEERGYYGVPIRRRRCGGSSTHPSLDAWCRSE